MKKNNANNSMPLFEMLGLLEVEETKVVPVLKRKLISTESKKTTEACVIVCCKNGIEVSHQFTESRFLKGDIENAIKRNCEVTVYENMDDYDKKYYPDGLKWLIPLKGASNEQRNNIQRQDISINGCTQ